MGPVLGWPVWEKRGGVVASEREREREAQEEGRGEQGKVVTQRGKLSFVEMGQHNGLAFTLCATSFAAELVSRIKVYGMVTVLRVKAFFTSDGTLHWNESSAV